ATALQQLPSPWFYPSFDLVNGTNERIDESHRSHAAADAESHLDVVYCPALSWPQTVQVDKANTLSPAATVILRGLNYVLVRSIFAKDAKSNGHPCRRLQIISGSTTSSVSFSARSRRYFRSVSAHQPALMGRSVRSGATHPRHPTPVPCQGNIQPSNFIRFSQRRKPLSATRSPPKRRYFPMVESTSILRTPLRKREIVENVRFVEERRSMQKQYYIRPAPACSAIRKLQGSLLVELQLPQRQVLFKGNCIDASPLSASRANSSLDSRIRRGHGVAAGF
ncbi:hypothetical protein CVT26_012877, partial [Gymnopilus dilepis]